jgi:NADPH:quinone reductase-like Zn-dependent oxidoreductase
MAIQVAKWLGAGRVVGAGHDLGRLEALASVGADAVVQLTDDAEATATALTTTADEVEGSSSSSLPKAR